mmetsp:Transcript_2115/g.3057  ORF Transcript_2115/g.3057 Transcript_2115/m.3057 type:complete len:505 (+) Transcript_2115:120-1634(+)
MKDIPLIKDRYIKKRNRIERIKKRKKEEERETRKIMKDDKDEEIWTSLNDKIENIYREYEKKTGSQMIQKNYQYMNNNMRYFMENNDRIPRRREEQPNEEEEKMEDEEDDEEEEEIKEYPPKKRKRRKKRQLLREEIESVIHLTQQEAAETLNICLSSLKRQFYSIYGKETWRNKRRMKINNETSNISEDGGILLKTLDAESILGNLLSEEFEGLKLAENGEEDEDIQKTKGTIVKYGTHKGIVYNPYDCPLNEKTEIILKIPMMPEGSNYDSFFESQKQVLINSGEGIMTNQGKKRLMVNREQADILRNLKVTSPNNVYSIILDKYLNVYSTDENFEKDYGNTLQQSYNYYTNTNSTLTVGDNEKINKPLYVREAKTLETDRFNISKFCIRNDIFSNMYYVGIINFWLSFPSKHSFIVFTDFLRVQTGVLQLFKIKLTKLGNLGLCMQYSPVNKHLGHIVTDKVKFKRPIYENEITNHIVLCRLMQEMLTYAITLEASQENPS